MSDWATECAAKWGEVATDVCATDFDIREAVGDAVREALAKAAEVADEVGDGVGASPYAGDAIRALGAKP